MNRTVIVIVSVLVTLLSVAFIPDTYNQCIEDRVDYLRGNGTKNGERGFWTWLLYADTDELTKKAEEYCVALTPEPTPEPTSTPKRVYSDIGKTITRLNGHIYTRIKARDLEIGQRIAFRFSKPIYYNPHAGIALTRIYSGRESTSGPIGGNPYTGQRLFSRYVILKVNLNEMPKGTQGIPHVWGNPQEYVKSPDSGTPKWENNFYGIVREPMQLHYYPSGSGAAKASNLRTYPVIEVESY